MLTCLNIGKETWDDELFPTTKRSHSLSTIGRQKDKIK